MGESERELTVVEGRGTLELNCLRQVPNFRPMEWILIQLSDNFHLVAMGTDQEQNRMKGYFFPVTEEMKILYKEGADLCVDTKGICFDNKMMREELLSFILESAFKNPVVLAASFPPDQVGPKWTNIYVQRVRS